MKKLIIAATLAFSGSTMAAGYGDAGCGLGSVILGGSKGFMQIFAATTNGTSGSQTFGITSGTSNCSGMGKAAVAFIEANKSTLESDIAKSNGETLNTLAGIYKVSNVSEMTRVLNKNHSVIFASNNASSINTMITTILENNNLI